MLGKLLKYEIKATARIFLPMLAVLIVLAFVNKTINLISGQEWQAPQIISMTLFFIVLGGIFVTTVVVMIQRFYKNLLSDEGYLMFTLPTKVWKHIVSKLLVAMMWSVVNGIAALISIFIITYDRVQTAKVLQDIINGADKFFSVVGISSALLVLELLLFCIISLASSALLIYASIALGHLFNKHRILASLGAFIVLNTVSQIFLTVIALIPGNINYNTEINTLNDFAGIQPIFHLMVWYCILIFGLMTAGYFFLTNYILSRKLNLE